MASTDYRMVMTSPLSLSFPSSLSTRPRPSAEVASFAMACHHPLMHGSMGLWVWVDPSIPL